MYSIQGHCADPPAPSHGEHMCSCVATPNTWCPAAPGIDDTLCLYKVVALYDLHAWGIALHEAGLLYCFPNLIFDLTYGAPISNHPPLTHIFIPNNLKSAELHPLQMDGFLASEVAMGQIDGPFTIDQAHANFSGHCYTAPLGLVEEPGPTTLQMIHHHS